MSNNSVRILRIRYEDVPMYKEKNFEFNFMATDRVSDPTQVFHVYKNIYTQKMISLVGINASGKTTALKLIHFAMSIVLDNTSLNEQSLYGREFLANGASVIINFYYKEKFYELKSIIRVKYSEDMERIHWYFSDEWVYCKDASAVRSKKDALTPGKLVYQRSTMNEEVKSFIKDDDSIIITITRDNTTGLHQMFPYTDVNVLTASGNLPAEALHVFDSNLDVLRIIKTENAPASYQVKMKDWEEGIELHNPLSLCNMISSGTIKGQNLIYHIKRILKSGGYIIIDELENHFNKELVRMITNIFKNERINKKGACLIFTTHYVELLDFVDRKDNIFIARKAPDNLSSLEILNYAKEVKRNDVKKSEVILSNYIQGTAPRYEYIQALEDSLCVD